MCIRDRIETQPFPTRLLPSSFTTRLWLHSGPRPRPFAGSNTFVWPQPRQTRLHRQRVMLLLATPASTFSAFTWHGIGCHAVHALVASRVDYCNAILAGALKVRQTSCNECWTPQFEWSEVQPSLTMACHGSCTPSCTGSMYLSESPTSWASWCSTAYLFQHLSPNSGLFRA